jgi:glycerate kinase
MIASLDKALAHFAEIIHRDLELDVLHLEGGGAAGGMGAGLYAFCGAKLRPGIEIVTDALHLADIVADADLVITGEGRMDSQTVGGKAPVGVARIAKKHGIPVIGIAGVLGDGVEAVHQHGIDAVFSILPALAPLAEVLDRGEQNLYACARNIACAIKLGQTLPA